MAKVPLVSSKEILARLARNCGGRISADYYDDILEWIPEAIDLLSNNGTLQLVSTGPDCTSEEVEVKNHVLCLPKDLRSLIAVEDEKGMRIPEGGDVTDLSQPSNRYQKGTNNAKERIARANVWAVDPFVHQTEDGTPTTKPGSSIPIFGEDLEKVESSRFQGHYYKIVGNYIQFSFEHGFVRLHYLARPLDKEGYPLVPDNEDFKRAVEFDVLKKMLARGFKHPIFSYDYCDQQLEKHAGRAISYLNYPSLDATARLNRSFIRLVPPNYFYDDFFVGSEQIQQIRK
jgi:hypothetical protein